MEYNPNSQPQKSYQEPICGCQNISRHPTKRIPLDGGSGWSEVPSGEMDGPLNLPPMFPDSNEEETPQNIFPEF